MCARRASTVVALTLAAGPAAALDLTEAERAAFRAEVRALLLEEPEIVARALSPAPSYAEEAARDTALLDRLAPKLFGDDADYREGPADGAPLVAFLPPACEGCADLIEKLRALVRENGATRLIVKDLPGGDERQRTAAAFLSALLAEAGPAAWREARVALPELPDPGDPAALRRLSQVMGWPADRVLAAMTAQRTRARLQRTSELVEALGFDVAPSYVVDGTLIRGDVPVPLLARYLPAQ
jgi:protein-disulfide isomerase